MRLSASDSGADGKGDGSTATDGGAAKHGASGGGAQGGVAGISATRSAPESDALNRIAPLLLLVLLALAAAAVVASRAHSRKDGFSFGRWFAALVPAAAATASPPAERKRTVPTNTPARTVPATTPARTLPSPAAAPVRERVAPPAPRRTTEWPAGTEDMWRCEIKWRSGYRTSCFRAVTHGPAHSPGGTIALSGTYKWLFKNDPEADTRTVAEVRRLAERLIGAGWEPVGRGRHWYELRFVWPREGAPSDDLAPAQ